MAIYEIYEPVMPGSPAQRAQATVFVRDGSYFWALILPFFWLAWHRLWLGLAAYLVFAALLSLAIRYGHDSFGILSFLPGLYLFLEGSRLIAAAARRRGLAFAGVVEGGNSEEAERRWFQARIAHPKVARPPAANPPAIDTGNPGTPEFGIFSGS